MSKEKTKSGISKLRDLEEISSETSHGLWDNAPNAPKEEKIESSINEKSRSLWIEETSAKLSERTEKEESSYNIQPQKQLLNEKITLLENENETLKQENQHLKNDLEARMIQYEKLKSESHETKYTLSAQIDALRYEYEDKIKAAEDALTLVEKIKIEKEDWNKKIKQDLNRIKIKEKELENKFELLRQDSQALLDSKDRQLLEIKNKYNELSLEKEDLEEVLRDFERKNQTIQIKKQKLIETLKLTLSLLENLENTEEPK